MLKPAYKRVLLKISGEALMGEQNFGIEHKACEQIAQAVKEVHDLNIQIGIVVGGGNIFRGNQAEAFGFARTPADHIGMLATTINGLVLQQTLAAMGVESRVTSALNTDSIVEPYNWGHVCKYIEQGIIVIFVGGTGNPYFTTDSAAALRASEINAEVLLKATKVDGVYSADPHLDPHATKFERLTYSEALSKDLRVMDGTALALCRDNQIPICVFNLFEKGAMLKAVCGQAVGSLVTGG
ncbi:MAG: UMP kinase [Verrucomicrobia bacterium]|nr:UMP kinase [Verrucomicrobiota bacterium]